MATSMVGPAPARDLRAPCCRTRPQRRPFDPDGADAPRVPACAAGTAEDTVQATLPVPVGPPLRDSVTYGHDARADHHYAGEMHGDGRVFEHQRVAARSSCASRTARPRCRPPHGRPRGMHRDLPVRRGRCGRRERQDVRADHREAGDMLGGRSGLRGPSSAARPTCPSSATGPVS
jgi:hypothetical protein